MVAAYQAIDRERGTLPVSVARLWNDHARALRPALDKLARAANLETRRVPFQPLSDTLWAMIQDFDPAVERPLRLFHCPMAFDNTGADWIQQDPQIANPYFGDMMLRCGSEVSIHE